MASLLFAVHPIHTTHLSQPKMLSLLLAAVLLAVVPTSTQGAADLVFFTNTSAVCLDGSPAGAYFQAGSPGNKTWIFMLEGGGLCSHEEDCKGRTKTALGSSKSWAKSQADLGHFQSVDAVTNPLFHDANMVFVPYCTGDVHSGTKLDGPCECAAPCGRRVCVQGVCTGCVRRVCECAQAENLG